MFHDASAKARAVNRGGLRGLALRKERGRKKMQSRGRQKHPFAREGEKR